MASQNAPTDTRLPVKPVAPSPTQPLKELPYWMRTTLADRWQDDKESLAEDLEALRMGDLRAMGKGHGWALRGARKEDIASQLAEYLVDPDRVRQVYAALDNEERRVLQAIMLLNDRPTLAHEEVEALAREFGPLRRYTTLASYINNLARSGLLLSLEAAYAAGIAHEVVPGAIMRALPPALEGIIPDAAAQTPQILAGETRLADAVEFARACGHVLLLLEESPTPLRPPMPRPDVQDTYRRLGVWDYVEEEVRQAHERGHLTRPDTFELTVPPPAWALPDEAIARLAPVAGGEARLEFIYELLVAAGVLQAGSPVTASPQVKANYLMRDVEGQRAVLARTYFDMIHWSEVWEITRRDPRLRVRRSMEPWHATLDPAHLRDLFARLRRFVLEVLSAVPDGQWVAMEDLLPLLRRIWTSFDPTALYPGTYPSHYRPDWELRIQRDGGKLANPEWDEAQGAFVHIMLVEPLHWLGLADLILSEGHLEAVRFTGLADLYWDRVEAPPISKRGRAAAEVSPEEALRVEDRREQTAFVRITVASSAVSREAHDLLGRIARLERATLDSFIYVLDAETAYTTFESGELLTDILEAWDRLLPNPVPPSVRQTLEDWWAAYGRVRVYQDVAVIEFGDDYALAEMKAVSSLDEMLVAELSPRAVVVPRQAVARLVAELEKAGYTPKQTDTI